MLVKELMRRDVLCCSAQDSLDHAAQLMWEHDVGALPVLDAGERPIGMITDRDVCMASYTKGSDLKSLRVDAAMSQGIYSCAPGDSVALAQERMRRYQVRRMPVVQDGRLVGLLSLNDLAIAALESPQNRASLHLEDVAKTLGRICQHRSAAPSRVAAE